jgi:hypothetical protein
VANKKNSEPAGRPRPIIPWIGGKSGLADRIIPLFTPHHCYVEVFAGAGSILFRKPESRVEILNDINLELVTLYRVIKHHLDEFIRYLRWLLTAREEFERFKATDPATLTDVQRAVRFYYLMLNSFTPTPKSNTFRGDATRRPKFNLLRIEEDLSAAHIASLPAFRVSPGARRGRGSARATRAGCGQTSRTRSRRAALTWSTSRTCAAWSRRAGSRRSLVTWPISGSMRSGTCCARPTSALRTSASGFLFWPTATAQEAGSVQVRASGRGFGAFTRAGRSTQLTLNRRAERWPTARSEDAESCGNHPGAIDSLSGATSRWKTPHGMAGVDRTGKPGGGGEFARQVERWSTPIASNAGGARMRSAYEDLGREAVRWPTPAARDEKGANSARHVRGTHISVRGRHIDQLPNYVSYSRQARRICGGAESSRRRRGCRRRLNPAFTAWLMGWPWWWTNPGVTSCARSATESWRCRLRQRLSCLLGEPLGRP